MWKSTQSHKKVTYLVTCSALLIAIHIHTGWLGSYSSYIICLQYDLGVQGVHCYVLDSLVY